MNLLSLFFNSETAMEDNLSRGHVSTSKQYELGKLLKCFKTLSYENVYCLWSC